MIFNFVPCDQDSDVRARLDKKAYYQERHRIWKEKIPHWFSNGMTVVSGTRLLDFGGCEGSIPYCTERFRRVYEEHLLSGLSFQQIKCDSVHQQMYLVSFDVVDVKFFAGGIPTKDDLPDFFGGAPRSFCCRPAVRKLLKKQKLAIIWHPIEKLQEMRSVEIVLSAE
jgi:hypothetical protein